MGYLRFRVRPFNSEVHSASALLPCFHHVLLGSLEIALKRTRPRQRIYVIGRYSMTEAGMCQEAEIRSFDHFLNLCIHNILNYFPIPVMPEEGALQKHKHP